MVSVAAAVVVAVIDVCVQEDEDGRADVSHLSDVEDNITEQTHHIIVPSYTSWFNYNRSVGGPHPAPWNQRAWT